MVQERCARLQRNFEALHSELQHFDSLQQEVVGQRKQQEDQYVKVCCFHVTQRADNAT